MLCVGKAMANRRFSEEIDTLGIRLTSRLEGRVNYIARYLLALPELKLRFLQRSVRGEA